MDIDKTYASVLSKFSFFITTQNKAFTYFSLVLRYILLGLSFFGLCFYAYMYYKMDSSTRTFEHKYILLLSISLFFFNDPWYAATLLHTRMLNALFSTITVTQFVGFLVFFWIVMMRRIHSEPVSIDTK